MNQPKPNCPGCHNHLPVYCETRFIDNQRRTVTIIQVYCPEFEGQRFCNQRCIDVYTAREQRALEYIPAGNIRPSPANVRAEDIMRELDPHRRKDERRYEYDEV